MMLFKVLIPLFLLFNDEVQSQTIFRVAIFGNFSTDYNASDWLDSVTLTNNRGENFTVEYVTNITIPDVPINLSQYESLVEQFANYSLSAIIADHHEGLKFATLSNNITYYVINKNEYLDLSDNMVYMGLRDFIDYTLLKVLLKEIDLDRVVSFKFTDAVVDESKFNELYIWAISIVKGDKDELTRLYESVFSKLKYFGTRKLASLMTYKDADETLFDTFGQVIAFNGLYKEKIVWIAHSLTNLLDPILFKYSEAGSTVMSFAVEKLVNYPSGKLSDEQIRHMLGTDARNHFQETMKTYLNGSIVSEVKNYIYDNGETGVVAFDNQGYRKDISYVVTHYHKSGFEVIYKIKNLNITSTSENVYFRNPRSVTKFLIYKHSFYYLLNQANEKIGFSISLSNSFANNFTRPLKFEYVEIPSANNSVINNAMKSIINGEADVCMMPIPQDKEFFQFNLQFDSTEEIFKSGFNILYHEVAPDVFWPSWIFIPFTLGVWISIVAALILAIFVNFLVGVITHDYSKYLHAGSLLHDSFFFAFTSLLKAQMPFKQPSISTRTFALFYWLFALIIVISYGSNLVAYLASSKDALPFSSLRELAITPADKQKFSWFYMLGDQPFYYAPFSFDEPTSTNSTRVYAKDINEAVDWMKKNSSRLLIQTSALNNFIRSEDCNFKVIGPSKETYSYVFIMRKTWALKNEFLQFIKSQIASGEMDVLHNAWFFPSTCGAVDSNIRPTFNQMTLEKLSGLFIIAGGSVVIAFLTMFLQYVGRSIVNCVRNKRIPKLEFGHEYSGVVDSIERTGIYCFINNRPRKYFMFNAYLHTDPLKMFDAHDLNLRAGDNIQVKYFGKDPLSKVKRFVRITPESEC